VHEAHVGGCVQVYCVYRRVHARDIDGTLLLAPCCFPE
jgi:hypothetical protein